jgi:O-antigen/teichoic acid export membrane protein
MKAGATLESSRKALTRNIQGLYAARAVGFLSGLVLVPVLISYLGLSNFGLWVLATAVFGYSGLLELGVSGAATKFVAQHRGEEDVEALQRTVNATVTVALIAGVLASFFLLALAFVGDHIFSITPAEAPLFRSILLLFSIRALFAFALALPEALLKGHERYDLSSMAAAAGYGATLLLTVSLLVTGHGLLEVSLVALLVPAFVALINAAFLARLHREIGFGLTRRPLRDSPGLLTFAAAGSVISLTTVLMYQADFFIVGVLLSTTAVGVYAVVAKFNSAVREFDWLTLQAVIPLASRLNAQGDTGRTRTLLEVGTRYLTVAEFTIVAALIAMMPALLNAWVGPAFVHWAWLGQLFLSYYLLTASVNVAGNILMGRGRMRTLLKVTVVTAALNFGLSIGLTWYWQSIVGVIVGTVIASFATYPYWLWAFSHELGSSPLVILRQTAPSYGAAGIAFLFGTAITTFVPALPAAVVVLSFVLVVAASLFIYALVFLDPHERALVTRELLGSKIADRLIRSA